MQTDQFVRVASLDEVRSAGTRVIELDGQSIALFYHNDSVYAVDNRCPHMGFPLHKGSCKDGILTCHWHHARFDLASGGAFDLYTGDVRAYPVRIDGDDVLIDPSPAADQHGRDLARLKEGLKQNMSLVIAKSVTAISDRDPDSVEPFRIGLEFGARSRRDGWSAGLTVLSCMRNVLPYLDPEDRPRALFHGLSFVANDCAGASPQLEMEGLPTKSHDYATLKRWFRQFVGMFDADGARRCLVTAIRSGMDKAQIADMLFSAVTDSRYLDFGHSLDFTNKALEALDAAGWDLAEPVLTSLVGHYANRGAARMEDINSWRRPIDLVAILENAFEALPAAIADGKARQGSWAGRDAILPILLGEDPQALIDALLTALRDSCTQEELAATVTYAAAMRIAQFRTSNELGDWLTVSHTFTFANGIHQGMRRAPSLELLRAAFDAAMSIYTDRFLNMPPVRIPEPGTPDENPADLLNELPGLLDQHQQVNQAGQLVARYLYSGGDPDRLIAALGKMLLREDRDFHVMQSFEAAVRQYEPLRGTHAGVPLLVAAARYLAAVCPTRRGQGQTFDIATRLHWHENVFEE